jgi:WD40 repeat protein
LLSARDWSIIEEIPVKPKGVYAVSLSADGRWLAMGAADRRVRVWDLEEA